MKEFADTRIDRFSLDEEWEKHSAEYGYWAEQAAELQSESEVLDSELSRKRSELDLEIRSNPKNYGLEKISESAVSSAILVQPEFQMIERRSQNKRKEMLKAKAVLSALDHRRRALESLVELWIRDYYSDMRAPRTEETRLTNLSEEEKRSLRRRGIERKEAANVRDPG